MSNVRKVHGPVGPPDDDQGKKEKVDAGKFKEAMRKRLEEVGKVDPDEQKKRKQREEGTEEKRSAASEPPAPKEQVQKFNSSPLSPQKGTSSPMQSPEQAAKSTFLRSSANPEVTEDSGVPEEKEIGKGSPPQHLEEKPHFTGVAGEPEAPQAEAPDGQKPVKPGPPQGAHGAKPDQKEDAQTFFEQSKKVEGPKKEEHKKPPEETASVQEIAPAPQPQQASSIQKSEEKKIEPPASTGAEMSHMGMPTPEIAPAPSGEPQPLPPYANLHPQVQELFDRMVGVMTVMNMSGMTETVITLNSPQFASSVFFGTQIIIQEFSTAPQAFNIQLNGSPQAVALIQEGRENLMAAFQTGNYNFRVNRLETGYSTERPLFRRKDKTGGAQDQTGDGKQ